MTIEDAGSVVPPPTDARLQEAERAMSDGVLADVMRRLADAVVIADPGGAIIFWNQGAERLFGWSAREAVGGSLDRQRTVSGTLTPTSA